MKFKGLVFSLVLTVTLSLVAVALAAGTEDPYFQSWARCKVGSSVSLTGTVVEPQGKSSFKQTLTLKEVKSNQVVLNISRVEGTKHTDKPKKVDKFVGSKGKVADLGQEEITLAGKKYKCRKYKLTYFYDNGQEMIAFTYWINPEIPGAAQVLAQAKDPKTKAISTATQTAVSWQKK